MKKLIPIGGVLFFWLLVGFACGQVHLNQAEYFYDVDPGTGNGTPVNISVPADSVSLNLNLPVTSLSAGFHNIFIRFRYNNGTWGLYEGRTFYILQTTSVTNTAHINEAEYFFDSDPGLGSGTSVSVAPATDSASLSIPVSTNGLSTGVHNLFIRFRYDNGEWGLYEGRPFYILPAGSINNAAQINQAEYFFDSDPGVGNAIAVTIAPATDSTNLSLNIPASGLASGVHNLFVRFRYNNGIWGLYEGRPFYILPAGSITNNAHINHAEYFFDTDPGIGNATGVTIAPPTDSANISLSISTNSLTPGVHNLFVRFQYDNGTWGLYEGRPFYVLPASVLNPALINQAEYFFDTDPGVGNATAINVATPSDSVSLALNLLTNGLATGFHNLFIRFRYNNGVWGLYDGRPFYILPSGSILNTAHINYAEYFYDTDPGVGNATAIVVAPAVDTANLSLALSVAGLSTGVHNLFIRFRYDNGTWGLYEGRPFYIFPVASITNSAHINMAEYFFDHDPGVGNGTPIPINPPVDTAILAPAIISAAGLSSGSHNLFIRFRYDNGTWGLYQGESINICTPPTAAIFANSDTLYCAGDSVKLTSNTSNLYSYQWQQNGVNITGAKGSTYTVHDSSGVYNIIITDTSGCAGTSNTITVAVGHPVFYNFSHTICTGSSYYFKGQNLNSPGVYADTLSGANGCDSIATLTLYVSSSVGSIITASICSGASYPFKGTDLTGQGTYLDTLPSSGGCDSIVTLMLSVNKSITDTILASICNGGSYLFNGQYLSTADTYSDTSLGSNGCDSITVLILTTKPVAGSTINAGVCSGTSYNFNGRILTTPATYYDTLPSSNGCDSIITLNLQVNAVITTNVNAAICQGNSYPFKGQSYTSPGVYYDTLTAKAGCDSVVILTLTVNALPSVSLAGNPDTLCSISNTITLIGGTPAGGIYSGTGVTGNSFNPSIGGAGPHIITYTYTDSNGCTNSTTETINVSVCTGVGNQLLENAISVYPNPVSDVLIAESDLFDGMKSAPVVYDVAGRVVEVNIRKQSNRVTFYTNTLASGVYWARFIINGEEISKKFVKAE